MKTLINISLALCLPLSAFSLLLGLSLNSVGYLLLAASSILFVISSAKRMLKPALFASLFVIAAMALIKGHPAAFLFYPVAASIFAAACFITSSLSSKCLIERIASRMETEIPEQALAYCRKVNHGWSIFLLANALIALSLASTAQIKYWALYNGLISYVLIGIFFFIEFIIRCRVRRKIGEQQQIVAG